MSSNVIERLYARYLEHPFISTDTRNLIPNSIFFALKGEHFDGNKFAQHALANGCVLAVVGTSEHAAVDERLFLVDDVLDCLQKLAAHHRKQLNIPVLGITGSNGKTTSKELINAVLSTQFKTHATKGNLNNHIGVPLTILSTPKDAEILIVEMGANHPHEIAELCDIAEPNLGLITSLGVAHLEGFGDFETIVKTKIALYQSVEKNNGLVFVNAQIPELMQHSEQQKRITYGSEHADFTGHLEHNGFFVALNYKSTLIQTKLIGDYNLSNLLAACAIGEYFKISPENLKLGLEGYQPENNRSQLVTTAKNKLILDAYNANPTSMMAALESFANMNCERKFYILGDMLELGNGSLIEHQRIISLIQNLGLNEGIFIGKQFHKLSTENIMTFGDSAEARDYLSKQKIEGCVILIKGSRGIQLETLVDIL